MLAGTLSTAVSGRVIRRTGRYKAFPVAGLGLMAIGLFLLSGMDASTSQFTASLLLVIFGVGFGMVSQVLTLAIQNAVERRDLGIATASANLLRSLAGRSASPCSERSSRRGSTSGWRARSRPARAP